MRDYCIDFDGGQVVYRTDLPEVQASIIEMFWAMLVPEATRKLGQIELIQGIDGPMLNGVVLADFGDTPGLLERMRHDILMAFILARRDLVWLHAAVVKGDDGAILIAGPSGAGKSSIATILCERGWRFLSDDAAPVSCPEVRVLPYPQTPRRRAIASQELFAGHEHLLERELRPISADLVWREPSRISQVIFLEFSFTASAELHPLTPGETTLDLIRNCTNFVDHKESAVAALSDVARAAPGYRLRYGHRAAAADAIEELLLKPGLVP